MNLELWIWQAFAIAIGLVIGSFLNVCIVRMPEDRSVVTPRSQCPVCGHGIRWYDNIPVVSWLILRGRCRDCGTRITARYALVEILTALLAWLLFRRLVQDPDSLDLAHGAAWIVYFTFICLLIVAAYVDLRHRIIPDQTSIFAIPFALGGVAALGWLGVEAWPVPTARDAVFGCALGGGFFGATALAASALRGGEALGFGDVKLMAMIGAFLGAAPGAFLVMLLGSMIGSAVGIAGMLYLRRRPIMAFGPSLAAASLVYLFYGDVLIRALLPGMSHLID